MSKTTLMFCCVHGCPTRSNSMAVTFERGLGRVHVCWHCIAKVLAQRPSDPLPSPWKEHHGIYIEQSAPGVIPSEREPRAEHPPKAASDR